MKIFALFFLVALTACNASNKDHLGKDKIDWQTDHDTALKASTKTGKPVFAFFEGKTSANKTLEKEILTHPLFIESIHTDFIPLLVKNNSASETQQILTKYNEAPDKLPVVRFLNGEGKDVTPRSDKALTAAQLLPRMQSALKKTGKSSAILTLIEPELVTPSRVALSQYCFWTGELVIGSIDGIIKTEAGWLDGREVTLVHYDKNVVSESEVISKAKAQSCANNVYRGTQLNDYRAARESDQKRQLQGTKFDKFKNLTPHQRTKINAFARTNPSQAMRYLTPSQQNAL